MSRLSINRRAALAGAIFGSAYATTSRAQQTSDPFTVADLEKFASLHRGELERAQRELGGKLALSYEGLETSVRWLGEKGMLAPEDQEAILSMIAAVFSEEALDSTIDTLRQIADKVGNRLTALGKVAVGIVLDSTEYARSVASVVDRQKASLIIAHDIQGALRGASAGSAIGIAFPGIGTALGTIIDAVAGGGASSVIGYYDFAIRES